MGGEKKSEGLGYIWGWDWKMVRFGVGVKVRITSGRSGEFKGFVGGKLNHPQLSGSGAK